MYRIVAVTVFALASVATHADTLRCGGSLVSAGDDAIEVLKKCGAPDAKQKVSEPVMVRAQNGLTYQVGTTSHEVWRYQRSSRQFPAVLTFDDNGKLRKIDFEK